MVNTVHISVRNRRNSYDFTLKRNLTVLRGNSATDKTTLYEMIRDYNNNIESGVKISCNKSVETLEGRNWEQQLEGINQSVVVIDKGSSFIKSEDFAKKVRGSDNYFLLITRDYLQQLPYSVDEISMGKLALFSPESFEWLILKSGVVERNLSLKENKKERL